MSEQKQIEKQAADIANLAMKTAADLATKTAETNAVINTNIEWMKKSLSGIEEKLNQMDKAFVTASQHAEVLRSLADHEVRINALETEKTRTVTLLTIGAGLLSILASLVMYNILGK